MSKILKVLYEDNHLIAVYKEHGVLVQGDKSGDECLMDLVKNYLRTKYKKEGKVFLGLLHRLDRPVAGIVLFAKTSKGASRLSEQIRNRTIKKYYKALVSVVPNPQHGKLVHFMVKNELKNKSWAYDSFVEGSKEAILDYKVFEERSDATALLEIDLGTGRHHQIRAQLASIGCPIVGDTKYGAKNQFMSGKAICLCAYSLQFKKATEDELVKLECEIGF
jgi:23S rRNA pseudouridine1911/1915/1917 synthase